MFFSSNIEAGSLNAEVTALSVDVERVSVAVEQPSVEVERLPVAVECLNVEVECLSSLAARPRDNGAFQLQDRSLLLSDGQHRVPALQAIRDYADRIRGGMRN